MAAVAAYWGGDAVVPLIGRCLAKIGQDKVATAGRGGVLLNNGFRLIPIMAVTYAAGLGFIAADRFIPAARLLTKAQTHGLNGTRPLLVEFTHAISDIHALTKSIPEYKQKRVPFAELMFVTLGRELTDLFTDPQDFDRRYDEFELISAMLYGDLTYEQMPVRPEEVDLTPGRYVWKHFHLHPPAGSSGSRNTATNLPGA